MSLSPEALSVINQFALAAIVVLLVTGLLIPKPAHEFVIKLLGLSHEREAKLAEELNKHSDTIVVLAGRLEKNTEEMARLTTVIREARTAR